MTGIYGQDWASYQSHTPSTAGIDFVFLKVTEGLTYESPAWKDQYADAVKAGLVVGFYHYPHMHNNDRSEANFFFSKVKPKPGELVVLDWEGYDANNAGVTTAEKRAFKEDYLKYMKTLLPHNPVGLYCNTDYWLNIDTTHNAGDFLWIATAGKPAGSPGIKDPWKFHQYGASGVDRDFGNFASRAVLLAWTRSFLPKPPAPKPPVVAKPTVTLTHLISAAKTDPKAKQGHTTYPGDVKIVESALLKLGYLPKAYASDGSYGTTTVAAYKKWQEHLGYKGADADGIPGSASLKALGTKYGFIVK